MDPLISIPREALAELLRATGSSLTPEEYVASLPATRLYERFASRAKAAAISKYVLVVVAIIAVLFLPGAWSMFGFSIEDIIVTGGLVAVTFFEYRVHRYFREHNPLAPSLGFRNQSCFAAGILVYGLYHAALLTQVSPQVQTMIETNNLIDPETLGLLQNLSRVFYLVIGVVGGVSQFGLAWYYRTAQVRDRSA